MKGRENPKLHERQYEAGWGGQVEQGEMCTTACFSAEWRWAAWVHETRYYKEESIGLGKKNAQKRKKEKGEESAIQVSFPFHRFYDLGDTAWMTHNVRYCNVISCPWRCSQKLDYYMSMAFIKVSKHCNKWTQRVGKSRLDYSHLAGGFFPLTYPLW